MKLINKQTRSKYKSSISYLKNKNKDEKQNNKT